MGSPTEPTRVFVSYSRRDRKWVDRIKIHLKPLVRERAIAFWDDSQIHAGSDWRSVITTELSSTQVAVLLVSADFLASDFVTDEELPRLLHGAEANGTLILALIVSPSRFSESALARFKTINAPDDPLIAMKKPEREDTLVRLAAAIHRASGAGGVEGRNAAAQPRFRSVRAAETPSVPEETTPSRAIDVGASLGPAVRSPLLYDSDTERPTFSSWIRYASQGVRENKFSPHPESVNERPRPVTMRTTTDEAVGVNKSLPVLSGVVIFEYRIVEPFTRGWHVYFAMIPMQQSQRGLLEVGGAKQADPRNARSPYRIRVFVPGGQYGDGEWHVGRIAFDFSGLPTASYSIFAARINEGTEEPASATLLMRRMRAWGE